MLRSRCLAFTAPALVACAAAFAAFTAFAVVGTAPANAADYLPGVVLIGYTAKQPQLQTAVNADIRLTMGIRQAATQAVPGERLLKLPRGLSVTTAVANLRRRPGVAYAVPDYIAHAAGSWIPNDPGRTHTPQAWQQMQWNFLPGAGVDAPQAWSNLFGVHRPGAQGVTIAVLDTGVAYRNWHQYKKSPDFSGTRFVAPHDFIANNAFPLDREGHGTFVTGTIAESTNNRFGLAGLAYRASIMPIRILDADGTGDAATIAKGIRYAVDHGARVINLSLEFSLDVTSSDIPEIISAITYAHRRGAVVVAAAGNEGVEQIAYPARAKLVISVGATTADRCLAEYSNGGSGLDLVAPGGGNDTTLLSDPSCRPSKSLPDIFQMTFLDSANPVKFGYPGGWFGTSMAAPHVSAAAAMVIASGVLGRHPTPTQILDRLEATAQHLGGPKVPNSNYGWGLIDIGTATTRSVTATVPTPTG